MADYGSQYNSGAEFENVLNNYTSDTVWVDLNLASGVTTLPNWKLRIRKIGKMVQIQGTLQYTSNNKFGFVLATIPDQFLPSKSIDIVCRGVGYGYPVLIQLFAENKQLIHLDNLAPEGQKIRNSDFISLSTTYFVD